MTFVGFAISGDCFLQRHFAFDTTLHSGQRGSALRHLVPQLL